MAKKKGGSPFGKLLMILGLVLVLGAGGLFGYNQYIDYQAGQASENAAMELVQEITEQKVEIKEKPVVNVEVEPQPDTSEEAGEETSAELLKVAELNGNYYMGVVSIEKLEMLLPVQSDWSDKKLKQSPCRYTGSLEEGGLVIAGHNYRRHFKKLANLAQGDEVVFTDLEGNQYFYEVSEICTLAGNDIKGMTESGYDLTLFTCNYGGKMRLTVRCTQIDNP